MFNRSFAHLEVCGRIGKDAALRTSKSGRTYVTFSVAVTEKAGNETSTTWYDVSYFCDQKFADLLKAGTLVMVRGEPTVKAVNVQGQPKAYLGVRSRDLTILAYPAKDRPAAGASDETAPAYSEADMQPADTDVPF